MSRIKVRGFATKAEAEAKVAELKKIGIKATVSFDYDSAEITGQPWWIVRYTV